MGQIFARGAPAVFDDRCKGRDGASNSLGEERVLHREDEGSCLASRAPCAQVLSVLRQVLAQVFPKLSLDVQMPPNFGI